MPYDSPGILLSEAKDLDKISMGVTPNGAPNAGAVGWN